MFGLGFGELLLLAAIALIVLGPEKLPHAARMAGAWYGRIRRTISTIQSEIEQEVQQLEVRQMMQAELEKVKAAEAQLRDEMARMQAASAAMAHDIRNGHAEPLRPRQAGAVFYFRLMGDELARRLPPVPYLGSRLP